MVQKKWSASDCCPKLQNKDGVTVAMVLAAGSCSEDVQRLWLEKWSASDCCPQLQNKDGVTVWLGMAVRRCRGCGWRNGHPAIAALNYRVRMAGQWR